MKARIYHNPRCSKSRATLELLRERGVDLEVIEYLREPLDADGLRRLLEKLGVAPRDIVRTSEAAFTQSGLDLTVADDASVIELVVQHPQIMQRPIVETGTAARIGRPPEQVLELFE